MTTVSDTQQWLDALKPGDKVVEVTDSEIVVAIQVDVVRSMRFDRRVGMDVSGCGSFLVRPDCP